MRIDEVEKEVKLILSLIHTKQQTESHSWSTAMKISLKKLHDCYAKWIAHDQEQEDNYASEMEIKPIKILTDINEIKQLKYNLDEDLLAAICTLVDRFKEKTELNIQGVSVEMYIHSNSSKGYPSILQQIITGVKTKVEI